MADTFFVGQTGDPLQVSTIVLNQILVVYGNAPVAAIGIVFKANMFITFLQMGLANGVQPLLGYNFGSGNMKRFREVENYTKKCCVIAGLNGVIYGQALTDIISILLSIVLWIKCRKRI